jgi:hypothetical protein
MLNNHLHMATMLTQLAMLSEAGENSLTLTKELACGGVLHLVVDNTK